MRTEGQAGVVKWRNTAGAAARETLLENDYGGTTTGERTLKREGVAAVDDLYIMGFSDAFLRILASRTAADACAHLMPYLEPGLRVLDAGCGPGSISAGLAEAIAPGELRGIDTEPSQVELAARAAAERGLSNAEFSVADVRAMPFEDGSFDAVHCGDLLAFVPDTGAALHEIRRVLKPGGMLGCREIIMDSFLIHPDPSPSPLARGYALFADLLEGDDGHPQMGKELAGHLERAGFADIRVSASFDVFAGPERLQLIYDLGEQWYFSAEVRDPAAQYGVGTGAMMDEIRQARDRWYRSPGAMAAFAYGEAVARRP